jgi:nitrite reductase (NO-forming)
VVDLKLEVPGEYSLVDHALARAARGLVGKLVVEGPDQAELFNAAVGVRQDSPQKEQAAPHAMSSME